MKNTRSILRCTVVVFLFTLLLTSCKSDEDLVSTKDLINSGKWKVTEHTVSPGVRISNATNAPYITDLLTVVPCSNNYDYYFEDDGTLAAVVNCSTSSNNGLRITSAKWELSQDSKSLLIQNQGTSTTYTIESVTNASLILTGKEIHRDYVTGRDNSHQARLVFTKF